MFSVDFFFLNFQPGVKSPLHPSRRRRKLFISRLEKENLKIMNTYPSIQMLVELGIKELQQTSQISR